VTPVSLEPGSLLTLTTDRTRKYLTIHATGTRPQGFEISLTHYAGGKVNELKQLTTELAPNQTGVIDYGSLKLGQRVIPLTITTTG
jgi:hypothetical protein